MINTNTSLFSNKYAGICVLIFLMSLVIIWCFGPMVLHPNSYYLEGGGDGIRNYYSVAYYAKYDSGLQFTGMNYPYSEHVLYVDIQYPLALLLSFIQQYFFDVSEYTVGVVNYVMMVSLLLSAIFIYLLLQQLKVKDWFAIPAAIAITILTPQLQRLTGHYSLAYTFFVPLLLYMIYRLLQSDHKWKWTTLMILMITFFGFTHLYYLAQAGSFILSFAVVWLAYEWIFLRRISKQMLFLSATIVVPFAVIEGLLSISDPVVDRMGIPYGFFNSYATLESVFHPPSWSYIRNFDWLGIVSKTQQGYAYVGIVPTIAIVLAIAVMLIFLIRRAFFHKLIPFVSPFLLAAAVASIPVLIFSMCLPWRWFPEWLDHFNFIRQFRALDRFAYLFYYVISIFSAWLIFIVVNYLFHRKALVAGWLIAVFVFFLWFADGWSNLLTIKNSYPNSNYAKEFFAEDNFTGWMAAKGYEPGDFQAILPLPFYHLGSEKLWLEHPISMYSSTWASLNTGLPIISSYMNRTSLQQTIHLVQLMADTLIEKDYLKGLKSDKPFLVVTSQETKTAFEEWLLGKATYINERGPYRIFLLPVKAFEVSMDSVRNKYANRSTELIQRSDGIYTNNGDTASIVSRYATRDTFTDMVLQRASGTLLLFDEMIPSGKDSSGYDISVWVKLYLRNYASPDMHVYQLDEKGNTISRQFVQTKSTANLLDGWARINIPIVLYNPKNKIKVELNCAEETISACRFMIRPLHTEVYDSLNSKGEFVYNNFKMLPE